MTRDFRGDFGELILSHMTKFNPASPILTQEERIIREIQNLLQN